MKERISSLIDGHHESAESFSDVISSAVRSDEALKAWETYSLIGDALRREPALDTDLTASVMAQLEHEPTVLSPASVPAAANDASMGWQRILPIAASVMGVAAVGWVALQMNKQDTAPMLAASAPQAAMVKPVVASATDQQRLNRDTALRAYVMAHQGTAGGTLPGVVPYVRTVAEMPQARR